MTVGKYEPVAVRPEWVFGVVAKELLPERIRSGRQRHRRSRMAGVRLLDRVHRERTDGVDTEQIDLRVGGYSLITDCHQFPSAISYRHLRVPLLDERLAQLGTRTCLRCRSFDFTP